MEHNPLYGTGLGHQQSTCGIKKIIDCKLSQDGRQWYKVKWEATWEPAENLIACQHLIDDFWALVNTVKVNEEKALQQRKRIKLEEPEYNNSNNNNYNYDDDNSYNNNDSYNNNNNHDDNAMNEMNYYNLSIESKNDLHHLLARAHQTLNNDSPLVTPSTLLKNMQQTQHDESNDKIYHNLMPPVKEEAKMASAPKPKGNGAAKTVGISSLKYVENFENPYVKIILVCKICNKEQLLKNAANWKRHYLTHCDDKPFKCTYCPKSFVQADHLRGHLKSKHGDVSQMVASVKQQQQQQQQQGAKQQQQQPQQAQQQPLKQPPPPQPSQQPLKEERIYHQF